MESDKGRQQSRCRGGRTERFLGNAVPGHRRPRCCRPALQPRCAPYRCRRTGRLVAAVRNPIISVRYVVRNPAMPHAALAPAAPADPAARRSQPPATAKPRGNPDLALAPRAACLRAWPAGARTRSSCPCRSPAIHGQLSLQHAWPAQHRPAHARGPRTGCAPPAPFTASAAPCRAPSTASASPCSASAGSATPPPGTRHPAARARRPPAPVPAGADAPAASHRRHHRGRGSRPAPRGCRLPRALARRHRRGARGPPRRRCGRTSHRRPDRIKCHRTKCPGAATPPPRAPVARPRQPTVATARFTQSGRAIQTIPY